jgi:hypothetical protein
MLDISEESIFIIFLFFPIPELSVSTDLFRKTMDGNKADGPARVNKLLAYPRAKCR